MFGNILWNFLMRLLPNWQDAESVRLFALKFLGYAEDWAAETNTTIDDKFVAIIKRFAENAELWARFYNLIVDLLGTVGDAGTLAGDVRVTDLADDAELDPVTIIALITAIIQAIQWWRSRRE